MEEPNETEMLRSALCMKEHELFALRTELERRSNDAATLAMSVERLEKTMAACYERILRRLDRGDSKRRRR